MALAARRELTLARLAAQRARIDAVLAAEEANQVSSTSEFPRSLVMKALLNRPAVLTTLVAMIAKYISARAVARSPNLYAAFQLLKSLFR
jgi:hypothetical protein